MHEWTGVVWVLVPIVAIIGGIASAIAATFAKARVRELEIRERIALIEKGIVPPPEVDPQGFDRGIDRYDSLRAWPRGYATASAGRHRRAGITLLGVGFGLMVLIGFSGSPDEGFAVGGFICVLGVAFLINSFFESRPAPSAPPNPTAPPGSPAPPAPRSPIQP
jgi:hypothetical protein